MSEQRPSDATQEADGVKCGVHANGTAPTTGDVISGEGHDNRMEPTSDVVTVWADGGCLDVPLAADDSGPLPPLSLEKPERYASVKDDVLSMLSTLLEGGSVPADEGGDRRVVNVVTALEGITRDVMATRRASGLVWVAREVRKDSARRTALNLVEAPMACWHDPERRPCLVAEQYVGRLPPLWRKVREEAFLHGEGGPQANAGWLYPCANCPRGLGRAARGMAGMRLGKVERHILTHAAPFDGVRLEQGAGWGWMLDSEGGRVVPAASTTKADVDAGYRARKKLRDAWLITTPQASAPGSHYPQGGRARLTEFGQRIVEEFRPLLEAGKPIRWGEGPARAAAAASLPADGLLRLWVESLMEHVRFRSSGESTLADIAKGPSLGCLHTERGPLLVLCILRASAPSLPDLAGPIDALLGEFEDAVRHGWGATLAPRPDSPPTPL
jgi:hypothetical protein